KGERSILIPDAIIRFTLNGKDYRFAIEYDNGTETPRYFASNKVRTYLSLASSHRPIFNLSDFRVLVFAQSPRIVLSLMKVAMKEGPPLGLFYFAALGEIAR